MSKPEMTREELARLRAVAEAATPGPWAIGESDRGYPSVVRAPREQLTLFDAISMRDARHVATFDPPTVLRLLDMVERQEEAVRDALDAERRACTDIAALYIIQEATNGRDAGVNVASDIADAIRARRQR